jgi:hypothetical protein
MLQLSGIILDAGQFVLDTVSQFLHNGLLGSVLLQYQKIAVLIVRLEAGIVPILDEMVAQVLNNVAFNLAPNVMPWHSWLISTHCVHPKIPDICEILDSAVVVLYSRIDERIVFDY